MNKLTIGNASQSDIETKLGISTEEGFNVFINKLKGLDTERNLRGFIEYGNYKEIANTFLAFDQVLHDGFCRTNMLIEEPEKLGGERWLLRGMIESVANSIDENYQYDCSSPDHEFLCNLRDLLCLCIIQIR